MLHLAQNYTKSIQEEASLTPEQLKTRHVGKQDPKRHLGDQVEKLMGEQVVQSLGMGVLSEVSSRKCCLLGRSSSAISGDLALGSIAYFVASYQHSMFTIYDD